MAVTYNPFTTSTSLHATQINSRLTQLLNGILNIISGSEALTSPTINSFANSMHDHTTNAEGGQIPLDALDVSAESDGTLIIESGVLSVSAGSQAWFTGDMKLSARTTAMTGWVFSAGRTIGSAASGATERANADTEDLFTYYWSNYSNTELVIQDSAGTPTTRGASAAADWAANKRMPTIDMRGRVPVGKDNLGGTSANRITASWADTAGGSGGAETNTLTTNEIPAHTHTETRKTAAVFTPGGAGNTTASPDGTTGSTGSGAAHDNVQPSIALHWFVKL